MPYAGISELIFLKKSDINNQYEVFEWMIKEDSNQLLAAHANEKSE